MRYYSAIMLPMRAYSRGKLICKNDFLGGGLFEGAGLDERGVFFQGFMVFL